VRTAWLAEADFEPVWRSAGGIRILVRIRINRTTGNRSPVRKQATGNRRQENAGDQPVNGQRAPSCTGSRAMGLVIAVDLLISRISPLPVACFRLCGLVTGCLLSC
jgi:hypothetical protein